MARSSASFTCVPVSWPSCLCLQSVHTNCTPPPHTGVSSYQSKQRCFHSPRCRPHRISRATTLLCPPARPPAVQGTSARRWNGSHRRPDRASRWRSWSREAHRVILSTSDQLMHAIPLLRRGWRRMTVQCILSSVLVIVRSTCNNAVNKQHQLQVTGFRSLCSHHQQII